MSLSEADVIVVGGGGAGSRPRRRGAARTQLICSRRMPARAARRMVRRFGTRPHAAPERAGTRIFARSAFKARAACGALATAKLHFGILVDNTTTCSMDHEPRRRRRRSHACAPPYTRMHNVGRTRGRAYHMTRNCIASAWTSRRDEDRAAVERMGGSRWRHARLARPQFFAPAELVLARGITPAQRTIKRRSRPPTCRCRSG